MEQNLLHFQHHRGLSYDLDGAVRVPVPYKGTGGPHAASTRRGGENHQTVKGEQAGYHNGGRYGRLFHF